MLTLSGELVEHSDKPLITAALVFLAAVIVAGVIWRNRD